MSHGSQYYDSRQESVPGTQRTPLEADGALRSEKFAQLPIGTKLVRHTIAFGGRPASSEEFTLVEQGELWIKVKQSDGVIRKRSLADMGVRPYENSEGEEWWNSTNYTVLADRD